MRCKIMLKKNLFKKITLAVLAVSALFVSVEVVCSATYKGKKLRNSDLTADDIKAAYDYVTKENNISDEDDYDYDGKLTSPEEDHEYKKWEKSALNYDNCVIKRNNLNENDAYDWEEEEEEEWNERTPNGYRRVGDYLSTTEEENNNLNENDDHSANAEENNTQNGNTATNNDNQNNSESSQNTNQRTVTPWHLIVFDNDNNK